MSLPFDLPHGRLPVIVPCPKVRQVEGVDETLAYEAHRVRDLKLEADRGLFDIGFMLNVHQFANLLPAERYTIRALQRRLSFSDKLQFPDLRDTGRLHYVEKSDQKLVWATIPETVVVTSSFTVLDLRDQRMALGEPEALRTAIEQALQGCPDADVEEMLKRFRDFNPPHRTDISRALKKLLSLGFIREYIKVDSHRRRAVFNMRMVANTRSGILRGMIAAEDNLRRVHGTEVTFSVDLSAAEPPVKRVNSTKTGRQKKITRAEYQSKFHSEREKRIKAEKRIADYDDNGYLTPLQFADLRKIRDDPAAPDLVRETLTLILTSVRCDPLTEIPEVLNAKDQRLA